MGSRDGPPFHSTCCSCTGPKFRSQHSHRSSRAWNYSSRGHNILFWPLWVLVHAWHMFTETHTHKKKIKVTQQSLPCNQYFSSLICRHHFDTEKNILKNTILFPQWQVQDINQYLVSYLVPDNWQAQVPEDTADTPPNWTIFRLENFFVTCTHKL